MTMSATRARYSKFESPSIHTSMSVLERLHKNTYCIELYMYLTLLYIYISRYTLKRKLKKIVKQIIKYMTFYITYRKLFLRA